MKDLEEILNYTSLLVTGGMLVAFGVLIGDLMSRYYQNKDKIDFKKKAKK